MRERGRRERKPWERRASEFAVGQRRERKEKKNGPKVYIVGPKSSPRKLVTG